MLSFLIITPFFDFVNGSYKDFLRKKHGPKTVLDVSWCAIRDSNPGPND